MVKLRTFVWAVVAVTVLPAAARADFIAWQDDQAAGDEASCAQAQRGLESRYIEQKLSDLGMDSQAILEGMPTLSDVEVHYYATNLDVIERGGAVTGKTVCAGLLSLLIWPGTGQYVNDCAPKKCWWHAGLGLLRWQIWWSPFNLFSGPDAFIGRTNGFWNGRI